MSVLCSLPYYALSPYLLRCLFVLSISIGKTSRIIFVLYVASALLKCNNKQKIYMQVNHPKSEKRHIRNKSYSSKHFLSKICKSLIQYWCSRILSPKLILARPKGGAAQTNLLRWVTSNATPRTQEKQRQRQQHTGQPPHSGATHTHAGSPALLTDTRSLLIWNYHCNWRTCPKRHQVK